MPIMPIPINTMHSQTVVPVPAPQITPQPMPKPTLSQQVPTVNPAAEVNKPAAICWQCRSPIAGKVVGCRNMALGTAAVIEKPVRFQLLKPV